MAILACRVVLVRPRVPENLGATARVMRNFGLTELVLVAPEVSLEDPQGRRLSTHGESILDQARIVGDLGQAVGDCVLVCATSARTVKLIRGQAGTPRALMARVVRAAGTGPVALVFGPERTGLANNEVTRCHHLLHIPADDAYPALNLAQAVAICLYELHCAVLEARPKNGVPGPAPFEQQEQMFEHLQKSFQAIHFLYGEKAETLMHGMRHLIGRAQPTEAEVGILHGLARQILWYAEHHG
jgi:tRNA/rRNA methyltransferase